MTQDQVIELMKSAKNEQDWNSKCDEVKKRCNGYPQFWYGAIIQSGILHECEVRWSKA